MWIVSGLNLQMTEGDYGIALPVSVEGTTLGERDSLKFIVKDEANGTVISEKTFAGITDNTVSIEFSAAESAMLPVGCYVYSLDWYQAGSFMCNIIPGSSLRVVDKI